MRYMLIKHCKKNQPLVVYMDMRDIFIVHISVRDTLMEKIALNVIQNACIYVYKSRERS